MKIVPFRSKNCTIEMSSEQFYAQSRALGKIIGYGLHGLGLSLILAAALVRRT